MVLFTALFAIGMAPKARGLGLGSVFGLAGAGLSVLAGSADRPEVLLVLAARPRRRGDAEPVPRRGVRAARRRPWPCPSWPGRQHSIERRLRPRRRVGRRRRPGAGSRGRRGPSRRRDGGPAVAIGGRASVGLAARTDRPPALIALLAAQAVLAAVPASVGPGRKRSARRGRPVRPRLDRRVLPAGAGTDALALGVRWPGLPRRPPGRGLRLAPLARSGRGGHPPRHRALRLDRALSGPVP